MMEQRYRHMMEQVNMDKEFEANLLERIREGQPKRRPRPLRTALIAACVCLALVGTAVAAQVVGGISISDFFAGLTQKEAFQKVFPELEEDDLDVLYDLNGKYSGYVVGRSGVGASLEDISDEALALLEKTPGSMVSLTFDSWDEAEAFLGLEIQNNEVLDEMYVSPVSPYTPCSVMYGGRDEVSHILLGGSYIRSVVEGNGEGAGRIGKVHTVRVNIDVEIYKEGQDQSDFLVAHMDGTTFTEETYVSPAGVEMTIVHSMFPETEEGGPYTAHEAYFYVGGAQYRVRAMDQEDPEFGWTALKEVLDAFAFGDLT